jgi:inhibitor of growth protein 4
MVNLEEEFCASEPIYCYCRRPSFGLMVKCESDFCEVEWFHRECIEEKTLFERWFCK